MSKKTAGKGAKPPPPDPDLEIVYDKASKFYEPGETVNGTINIFKIQNTMQHGEIVVHAEAFMDTVSAIRGPMGRPAMKPEDRTMFMSKKFSVC